MKLNYIVFLKKLILFTIILAVVGTGAAYLLPDNFVTPTLPYLYVFFFASTVLVHFVLLQVAIKKASSFINYFMLLTFGKLMFFLSIVLIYALVRKDDAVPFILTFFILYVFFTVFEVLESLSITKAIHMHRNHASESKEYPSQKNDE